MDGSKEKEELIEARGREPDGDGKPGNCGT